MPHNLRFNPNLPQLFNRCQVLTQEERATPNIAPCISAYFGSRSGQFLESLLAFFGLHWDDKSKTRKLFGINGLYFGFRDRHTGTVPLAKVCSRGRQGRLNRALEPI